MFRVGGFGLRHKSGEFRVEGNDYRCINGCCTALSHKHSGNCMLNTSHIAVCRIPHTYTLNTSHLDVSPHTSFLHTSLTQSRPSIP